MFVELLELLRCPRPHDESPLIASAVTTVERHIVEGALGCPVCGAEFPIIAGVTHIDDAELPRIVEVPRAEIAMRLAAFLDLTDARAFAMLCGQWGAHSDQINRLSETRLVLVNPPERVVGHIAATIRTRDAVPFAAGCAGAVALDDNTSPALTESLLRAVRHGGRVLGPTSSPVPPSVTEIVRDDRVWLAERTESGAQGAKLVSIQRERGSRGT